MKCPNCQNEEIQKEDEMTRKVLEAEKKASEAKKESHSAVVWALVALGISILRIVLKELGIT